MKTALLAALVAITAVVTPSEGLAQTSHNPQHRVTLPAINPAHLNGRMTPQLRIRPMQGTTCVKRVDGRNAQCITFR